MARLTKKARRLAALKGWRNRKSGTRRNKPRSEWEPTRTERATMALRRAFAAATGTQKRNPSKRSVQKRVSVALKKWLGGQKKKNPCPRVARGKGVTLRNMASVTIRRLPGGAVAVTGRKMVRT